MDTGNTAQLIYSQSGLSRLSLHSPAAADSLLYPLRIVLIHCVNFHFLRGHTQQSFRTMVDPGAELFIVDISINRILAQQTGEFFIQVEIRF